MTDDPTSGYQTTRAVGILLILFGILCLLTSMVLTRNSGQPTVGKLTEATGEVGPIVIKEDNTVLLVELHQPLLKDNAWSEIHAEVLDAEKETLFAFGEELWSETGYDGGHWRETKNTFDLKVTIPVKGTYYLAFETAGGESGYRPARPNFGNISMEPPKAPPVAGTLTVKVTRKVGSTVPHFGAGFLSLLFGIAVFLVARSQLAAYAEA